MKLFVSLLQTLQRNWEALLRAESSASPAPLRLFVSFGVKSPESGTPASFHLRFFFFFFVVEPLSQDLTSFYNDLVLSVSWKDHASGQGPRKKSFGFQTVTLGAKHWLHFQFCGSWEGSTETSDDKMLIWGGESHFLLGTHSIIMKTSASSPGRLHPLLLSLYPHTHTHAHAQAHTKWSVTQP